MPKLFWSTMILLNKTTIAYTYTECSLNSKPAETALHMLVEETLEGKEVVL